MRLIQGNGMEHRKICCFIKYSNNAVAILGMHRAGQHHRTGRGNRIGPCGQFGQHNTDWAWAEPLRCCWHQFPLLQQILSPTSPIGTAEPGRPPGHPSGAHSCRCWMLFHKMGRYQLKHHCPFLLSWCLCKYSCGSTKQNRSKVEAALYVYLYQRHPAAISVPSDLTAAMQLCHVWAGSTALKRDCNTK